MWTRLASGTEERSPTAHRDAPDRRVAYGAGFVPPMGYLETMVSGAGMTAGAEVSIDAGAFIHYRRAQHTANGSVKPLYPLVCQLVGRGQGMNTGLE